MLYSILMHSSQQELNVAIVPGLYPIMVISKDDFDYHISIGPPRQKKIIGDYMDFNEEFQGMLTAIVEEIYNPSVPFLPTEIKNRCEYCLYRMICHR